VQTRRQSPIIVNDSNSSNVARGVMTDELIGKRFGGYEILSEIGRGGMATVYRAAQVAMRSRVVALKILPRQFINDENYIMRFNREVEIVASLEHRSIVPVYDHGDYDGQPYIVMRYMSGGSVDDLLNHGVIPDARILSILEQIAPALDYAHSRHVLHRDLKPSNVLMDDDGGAYLTDFGIARIMNDPSVSATTQGVIGTPSYMSPEQAQGQTLDGRSDIYSLGVMTFEMATGRRPFESDTPYSVAVLHVTAPPPTPRSVNPNVTGEVEAVILAAMRKRRDERFQDGASLVSAFRRAVKQTGGIRDSAPEIPRASRIDSPLDDSPTSPTPALPIPNSPLIGAGYIPAIAPRATAAVPDVPRRTAPVSPPMYTPLPPVIQGVYPPPSAPIIKPRRTIGGIWIGALVGGLIGCGLLTAILIALVLVVMQTSQEENSIRAATQTVDALATLDAMTPVNATTPTRPTRTVSASTPTLLPGVMLDAPIGIRDTDTTLSGRIVYAAERDNSGRAITPGEPGDYNLYWLDLATRAETRLTGTAYIEIAPAVSPDGDSIAFIADRDNDFDLYVMNVRTLAVRRLTQNNVPDRAPAWSTDGAYLVYSSATDDGYNLYRIDSNGNNPELIYDAPEGQRASDAAYSSDGRYLLFTLGDNGDASTWEIMRLDTLTEEVIALTDNDVKEWGASFTPDDGILYLTERVNGDDSLGYAAIARMNIDGGDPALVYDGDGYESSARFSADGELLIFTSDVSGRDELYALPAADLPSDETTPELLTTDGGFGAVWLGE